MDLFYRVNYMKCFYILLLFVSVLSADLEQYIFEKDDAFTWEQLEKQDNFYKLSIAVSPDEAADWGYPQQTINLDANPQLCYDNLNQNIALNSNDTDTLQIILNQIANKTFSKSRKKL